MFNEWQLCESLVEHVEALASAYRTLAELTEIKYCEEFVYLVSDASR